MPLKHYSLNERADAYRELLASKGWQLLQQLFKAEIKTRISDQDAKEAFLFEAVRAQTIQEIFSTPVWTIQESDKLSERDIF